jgi:cell division protein FtsB
VIRSSRYDRRNKPVSTAARVLLLVITASSGGYFAHHAINGRHGWNARLALHDRQSLLEFERVGLESVRSKLARDVQLLTPDVPDADFVEEIARDVLGYVHPADRIIASR